MSSALFVGAVMLALSIAMAGIFIGHGIEVAGKAIADALRRQKDGE